ncbi:MAG: molybdopterin-dependent oxidoreductase [Myxococcota bacterium]
MADAETHFGTCPLCEAMCGLALTVDGGRVTKIRANEEDVWSRGFICPKGTAIHHLHDDPDRLRTPRIRNEDGTFREASWEEAFDEIERRLIPIAEEDLPSVAVYFGNPLAHNFSLSRYVGALINFSGLTSIYSAGTVDQWPKNLSSALMYGSSWTVPIPDVDRTDFLMVLGANPFDSQGSLLAAPGVMKRLRGIQERGGRFVVVDPRRTGTAERADEWVPIRPGTDAALLLGMLHVIFDEGLVNLGAAEGKVNGLAELESLCEGFSPAAVSETCRVPAEQIASLARELAATERASVYGRLGTCTQEFGTLASWLVDVLNIVTGNFDRLGGAMFSKPIAWSMLSLRPPEFEDGFELNRFQSRVRGAPEVLGQFPASCLAEEIATPGEGRVRALITVAGNPVLSTPDAGKLDAALPELEFMVSVDNWLNETTRHAHVVLPGQSPLEQPHYDEMLWSWAVRSAGKYAPALFEPQGGTVPEWQIMLRFSAMLQGQPWRDIDTDEIDMFYFVGLVGMIAEREGSPIYGRDPDEILAEHPEPGPERLLDFAIRTGPWGDAYGASPGGLTLDDFKASPHGIDKGPMVPRLDEIIQTESGKVELAPAYIVADLDRLRARLGRREDDSLVLVSRRQLRSNNSWMHNVAPLMTGKPRCTLLMHPDDARAAGVDDGALASVTSDAGSVDVPVEVSDEMSVGVVCLPHGWGHDRPGAQLSVASQQPGVCNNLLAPGELVDVPSGNAVVNGIPVRVAPAG